MNGTFMVKNRKIITLILFLLIPIIFCYKIFFKGFLSGTDSLIWITWLELIEKNNAWFTVWKPFYDFGEPLIIYNLQINPLVFLLNLFFNSNLSIKLCYFLGIFLTCITAFIFLRYYFDHYLSLFGSIIYVTNQLFVSQLTEGHLFNIFGYALFPLLILYYLKIINKNDVKKNIFYFSLIFLAYIIMGQPYNIYMSFFYISLIFIINLIHTFYYSSTEIYNLIKRNIYLGLTLLPISFIYLYPFIMNFRQIFLPLNREGNLILVEDMNLIDSLMSRSTEVFYLYFGFNADYPLLGFKYIGLIIPILSYITIYIKKDYNTKLFILLSVISTFLATGVTWPFGFLYKILYHNFPFFSYIWFTDRWLIMQSLSYTYLICVFIQWLFNETNNIKINLNYKKFIVFFIILSNILYSFNAFIYGLDTFQFSNQIIEPYHYFKTNSGDYAIMTLPYRDIYSTSNGVSRSPHYFSPYIHNKVIILGEGGTKETRSLFEYIQFLIDNNSTDEAFSLLGNFNIKYLIIQNNFHNFDKSIILNKLSKEIIETNDNFTILSNNNWKPLIYGIQNSASLIGGHESLTAISRILNINTSDILLYDEIHNRTNSVIFCNTELFDLYAVKNKNHISSFSDFVTSDKIIKDKNIDFNDESKNKGYKVYSDKTILLNPSTKLRINFNLREKGKYNLFIHVIKGTNYTFLINKNISYNNSIKIKREWIKLDNINLEKNNNITIINNKEELELDCFIINKKNNYVKEISRLIENTNNICLIYDFDLINKLGDNKRNVMTFTDTRIGSGKMLSDSTYNSSFSKIFESNIPVHKSGEYYLHITGIFKNDLKIIINKDELNIKAVNHSGLSLYQSYPILLNKNRCKIEIYSRGDVDLDQICILNKNFKETISRNKVKTIHYEEINPTRYKISISSKNPFYLQCNFAYNPLWKLSIKGKNLSPVKGYGWSNSYLIEDPGNYEAKLIFQGQKSFEKGALITLISLIFIFYITILRDYKRTSHF
jgi:hypothetical protein